MKGDYSIVKVNAKRILVIIHPICSITRAQLDQILVESGVDLSCVEYITVENVDALPVLPDGTPVIFPVDQNLIDDEELQRAAMACANIKGHVISIYGPDVSFDNLSKIGDNYGQQIMWNSKPLNRCLVNPGKTTPTDSFGNERNRSRAEQVGC